MNCCGWTRVLACAPPDPCTPIFQRFAHQSCTFLGTAKIFREFPVVLCLRRVFLHNFLRFRACYRQQKVPLWLKIDTFYSTTPRSWSSSTTCAAAARVLLVLSKVCPSQITPHLPPFSFAQKTAMPLLQCVEDLRRGVGWRRLS